MTCDHVFRGHAEGVTCMRCGLRMSAEDYVAAFIRSHQAGENSAEPLTAEELAWFNDWFEPIVQDKQGNDIGVNARCCFFTSYYDDVTELNFEEFMRYFPGDGSQTSEAEFEALRGVGGWPFEPHPIC